MNYNLFYSLLSFTPLLIIPLIIYLGYLWKRQKEQQALDQIKRGEYWVRWAYSPEESEKFYEMGKKVGYRWIFALWSPAYLFLLANLFFRSGFNLESFIEAGFLTASLGFPLLFLYLKSRSKNSSSIEIYISHLGLWMLGGSYGKGVFIPQRRFQKPTFHAGPPALLNFPTKIKTRGSSFTYTMPILVPAGREEEARGVLEKFVSFLK